MTDDTNGDDALQREKELARLAAQTRIRLLANLTHEVRTPLHAVLGLTNLCLRTDLTSRQRDYLAKISASAAELGEIIDNVFDLSRAEVGTLRVDNVAFVLDDVLRSVSDTIGLRADAKKLECVFDIASDLPLVVVGDPVRLRQVLLNLVGNAVKFTERGVVVLRLRMSGADALTRELHIEVQDSGVGMTPEQLASAFTPFEPGDSSLARRYRGAGLGLALTRHLLALMGGRIELHSAAGEGTTARAMVTVGVSLAKSAAPSAGVGSLPVDTRVLIVDDHADARAAVAGMLDSWSLRNEEAPSGIEALAMVQDAAARGTPFGLVIVDWRMPGMDGLVFGQQLLSAAATGTPRLLLLSGHGEPGLDAQARAIGFHAVLHKPASPSALHDAMVAAFADADPVADSPEDVEARFAESLRDARVLLVEDNDINMEIATELLERVGVEVTPAADGAQALARVRAEHDAVLMDLHMPVMDGYEAFARIRARPELAQLPVIALTAAAMADDRARVVAEGFADFVAKPVEPGLLYAALDRAVSSSGHRASGARPHLVASPAYGANKRGERPKSSRLMELRIDGIDLTAALRRLGGNEDLLQRLLRRFVDTQSDAVLRLRQHARTSSLEAGVREAHTLKGLASNLGATRLAEDAAALEVAFRDGRPVASLIGRLESSLSAVKSALDRVLPQEAAPAPSFGTTDPAALRPELVRLGLLLQAGDTEATALAEELVAECVSGPVRDRLVEVHALALAYDLEGAAAAVTGLLNLELADD